jgi:hypothetical protein
VLLVAEYTDHLTWKSARNLTNVHVLDPGQLNTYDVLISDDVVFTKGALDAFLAGPRAGKSAKGAASSDEIADSAESSAVADIAEQSIEATQDAEVAAKVSTEKAAKISTEKPKKKAAAAKADDATGEVSVEKPAKKAPAKKAAAKKAEPEAAADDEESEES